MATKKIRITVNVTKADRRAIGLAEGLSIPVTTDHAKASITQAVLAYLEGVKADYTKWLGEI
jgi:hypothetical protein